MAGLEDTRELFALFADATRVRLLALLGTEELSVAELTRILELPQSRVSTHLAKLKEAGLVRDRRRGTSSLYAMTEGPLPDTARELWSLIQGSLSDAVLDADRRRSEALIRARAAEQPWPDSIAGEMERHYSPGRTWEATAWGLLAFVELGDVLDVGSGDGVVAELLAPRARSVTCLDKSPVMIAAAKQRLRRHANLRFVVGDMLELPFAEHSFDALALFHVLGHVSDPERALGEACRVLRPGGVLSLLVLGRHEHSELTRAYGHVQPGFAPATLRRMLLGAGLDVQHARVTSRERRYPNFEVLSAFATRPKGPVRRAARASKPKRSHVR